MASRPQHRKRVRHYDEPGDFHELTFSCYRRMPLLTNNRWRAMLSEAITAAVERHAFHLVAFVYMPEHVHLLVYPVGPAAMIENLLRAIKRPFSYRIKQLLEASSSPLLEKLTIRQRPGVPPQRHAARFLPLGRFSPQSQVRPGSVQVHVVRRAEGVERRVPTRVRQGVVQGGFVRHTEATTKGRLAGAENVPSKADARAEVVVVA